MADAEDSKPFHPRIVTIAKNIRIKGQKVPRRNIIVKKYTPEAFLSDPRRQDLNGVEPSIGPGPGPRTRVDLHINETNPGFKEGKLYYGACRSCKKKNLTVQRKGNQLLVVKLVLCCPQP